jgi:hypothetical protein
LKECLKHPAQGYATKPLLWQWGFVATYHFYLVLIQSNVGILGLFFTNLVKNRTIVGVFLAIFTK